MHNRWRTSLTTLALTATAVAPSLAQRTFEGARKVEVKRAVDLGRAYEIHNIAGLEISGRGSFATDGAAEIVATVVPPGAKPGCPAGRLLLSLDGYKDPGAILGRDLDDLAGSTTTATFTGYVKNLTARGVPIGKRRVLSNDQDLVTLRNGDVLYVRMGQTTKAIPGGPAWFEHTYKLTSGGGMWGPGARSEVLVFRSGDCGQTFDMVSTLDTALLDDGHGAVDDRSGGLPQTCGSCPQKLPSGKNAWQMGGTDGPLTRVDPRTGTVYVSIGIVGHVPATGTGDVFMLSSTEVNRTVVMASVDNGSTWQRVSVLPYRSWRSEIVPMGDGLLAFGAGRSTRRVRSGWFGPDGTSVIDGAADLPGSSRAWTTSSDLSGNHLTGLRGQSILTGLGASDATLLLVRDTHDGTQGGQKGYRAYTYDWSSPAPSFLELSPAIVPLGGGPADFIFNPVTVDLGRGPVFVYWYDVTTDTETRGKPQEVRIRGRFILGGAYQTRDFSISGTFDVSGDTFYGHYQMAGGYRGQATVSSQTEVFFPVWLEPGAVHFARIEYTRPVKLPIPYLARELELPSGIIFVPEAHRVRAIHGSRRSVTSAIGLNEHHEEESRLESRALEAADPRPVKP